MNPSNREAIVADDERYDSFALPVETLVRGLSDFSVLASSVAGRAIGTGFSVASD
jgi:hypothetical protein